MRRPTSGFGVWGVVGWRSEYRKGSFGSEIQKYSFSLALSSCRSARSGTSLLSSLSTYGRYGNRSGTDGQFHANSPKLSSNLERLVRGLMFFWVGRQLTK